MVGLTSFMLFPIQPHTPPYTKWFRNDKSMWEVIGSDTLVAYLGNISNLVETFASGPFPLYKGRTERISMSELHSYDPLEGLSSPDHTAPALFQQKRIVQIIYEKDYRFAQPPKMPTLTATPLDGKVILTWDNIADTKTRDPFVGNDNDFEGYKLFRATDKKMADAEVITDGFGTAMFKKPIFQCDLKDNRLGFTNFGMVNGVGYNLGYDSGVTHYFVDSNVQNGRTYYYALVAYDYGAPNIGPGIAPSENSTIIELDEAEQVRAVGKNIQIVTPHQMAAGYQPPTVDTNENQRTLGTGSAAAEILANGALKLNHTYKVKFGLDTVSVIPGYDHGIVYTNNSINVYDMDSHDALVYTESPSHFSGHNLMYEDTTEYSGWSAYWYLRTDGVIATDIFDGLRLNVTTPIKIASFDPQKSGWVVGSAPMNVLQSKRESYYFPWDYEIVFTGKQNAYTGRVTNKIMRDEADVRVNRAFLLTNQQFSFYVRNTAFKDSTGQPELLDLVVQDMNKNLKYDPQADRVLVGPVTKANQWAGTVFVLDFSALRDSTQFPKANDVYRVVYRRPFWHTDSILFKVEPTSALDTKALQTTMSNIRVVPNPYVATSAMETAVSNTFLNQRRSLMFTNLPARCDIKIFTVSGVLVDEINVENTADNGIAHWDLLSNEGLEVAAGMYIFYVKAKETGDEKMGKFAIIK
jgi:hypothetical protein